jgi:hypothetical protein
MVKYVTLGFAILLPLSAAAQSVNVVQGPEILRGIARFDEPVSAGTITVSSGAEVLQTVQVAHFVNGTFSVPLNAAAQEAFISGDTRVKVETQGNGNTAAAELMADIHQLDPNRVVVRVDPVTSIAAAYRDLKPLMSVDDARSVVSTELGIGSLRQSPHMIDFDSESFMLQSRVSGGFNNFVKQVAGEIASGSTLSIAKLTPTQMQARAETLSAASALPRLQSEATDAASVDVNSLFVGLLTDLCGKALGALPLGEVVSGWMIDQVLNNIKSEKPDPIASQLASVAAQQQQVLDGLGQLQAQIAQLQTAVKNAINRQNYQNASRAIQDPLNDLLDMEEQLELLASIGLDPSNLSFGQALLTRIQNSAGNDLKKIWSGLEGNNAIALDGVIDLWSTAIGPGPGAPIFTNNAYLKSAIPLEAYYFGIQTIGLNLQFEYAHSLQPTQSALSNALINNAYKDFNSHHDTQMKLVAHNRNIAGLGLYAARIWPDSRYKGDVNLDNYTIDTRSGLLWSRRFAPGGEYQAYPSVPPNGFEIASNYVAKVNASIGVSIISDDFPIYLTFNIPTRDQWTSLVGPPRATTADDRMDARAWLIQSGISLLDNKYSMWTGDVAKSVGEAKTFPNWDNWLIDISNTRRGVFWYLVLNNPNDPQKIGDLLIVSSSPLNPSNQVPTFLYKTGQDVVPLK